MKVEDNPYLNLNIQLIDPYRLFFLGQSGPSFLPPGF